MHASRKVLYHCLSSSQQKNDTKTNISLSHGPDRQKHSLAMQNNKRNLLSIFRIRKDETRRREMRKEIFLLSRIIYRKINSIARRFSPCWRRILLVVLVAEVFRGWKRLYPPRGCLGEIFMAGLRCEVRIIGEKSG